MKVFFYQKTSVSSSVYLMFKFYDTEKKMIKKKLYVFLCSLQYNCKQINIKSM